MFLKVSGFTIIMIILIAFHVLVLLYYSQAGKELEFWRKETDRNVSHYLNPQTRTPPENFCKYPTTLLIMVHSVSKNKEARDAIRQTWGNSTVLNRCNTSLFFLLGESRNFSVLTSTKEENLFWKDLIVEDFIDSYSNLTLKSVAMLKLFMQGENCKFLLKADEDLFVNVEKLVSDLKKRGLGPNPNLLMGRAISNERRQNNYRSKWYAPRYMYTYRKYPKFLAGPAYVMSQPVARKLYQVALTIPLFHLEDVFLTGICAEKAGVERLYVASFTDFGKPRTKCRIWKLFTAHSFDPQQLIELVENMKTIKKECVKESTGTVGTTEAENEVSGTVQSAFKDRNTKHAEGFL